MQRGKMQATARGRTHQTSPRSSRWVGRRLLRRQVRLHVGSMLFLPSVLSLFSLSTHHFSGTVTEHQWRGNVHSRTESEGFRMGQETETRNCQRRRYVVDFVPFFYFPPISPLPLREGHTPVLKGTPPKKTKDARKTDKVDEPKVRCPVEEAMAKQRELQQQRVNDMTERIKKGKK